MRFTMSVLPLAGGNPGGIGRCCAVSCALVDIEKNSVVKETKKNGKKRQQI